MKKTGLFFLGIFMVLLAACSGSDVYRGNWKATDKQGTKFEIAFEAKNFAVKDTAGASTTYEYTQNSVKIENSVKTYGIKLGDGRGYQINFPNAGNESVALMKDENGQVLYTMSRNEYINYDDVFKLK